MVKGVFRGYEGKPEAHRAVSSQGGSKKVPKGFATQFKSKKEKQEYYKMVWEKRRNASKTLSK